MLKQVENNVRKKHPFMAFSTVCMLLFTASTPCITITVDPAVQYQTFEGWGTSLCWWAVTAGGWSDTNRKQLVGAIVDPDTGLGYTCFRYNIGGGDNPAHTHLKGERAVPGFKATAAGNYDWNADKNQRAILLDIAAREKSCIFEAFSNSPPWWMTLSGCASGNTNGADNLKPENFTAFADYLTDIVKYYKEQHGIHFRTIEPFNEPSSGYWKINGGQEGCGFKSRQAEMIRTLGRKLVEKNLFPGVMVSAADETSLAQTVTGIRSYDDSAFYYLSQINSHSYDGWSSRRMVDSLARMHKKNLWQSESGPLSKKDQSDITMWMSHVIIQDLRVLKANAWIDWQVGDPSANWRSIEMRDTDQKFTYTKRFYMHAAFSRFIRPGSHIIYSSDTNSVAAMVPSTGKLAVVLRNDATTQKEYAITLTQKNIAGDTALVYRFSLPGSLKKLDDAAVADGKLTLTAPGQTITTVLFSVPGTSLQRNTTGAHVGNCKITVRDMSLFVTMPSRIHYRLNIYSSSGTLVMRRTGNADILTQSFDLAANLHVQGMYIAELVTAEGRVCAKVPYVER
jgi:O-glycosyl hydrolase